MLVGIAPQAVFEVASGLASVVAVFASEIASEVVLLASEIVALASVGIEPAPETEAAWGSHSEVG